MLDKQGCLRFLRALDDDKERMDYWLLDHLRMSGLYWALTALDLLGVRVGSEEFSRWSPLTREEIVFFLRACRHANGGFGGNRGQDPHLLFTLSAIQVCLLIGAVEELGPWDATVAFIQSLQLPDGSFQGDQWGERDTRFTFVAFASLRLLKVPLTVLNLETAISFLEACRNFDGGYGVLPGRESHAGQIYCCVSALAIAQRLDLVDKPALISWLAWRQLPIGGFNGRPEKLEDVCYSWWVLSSLCTLDACFAIDGDKLTKFIYSCQDPVAGGIGDRPDDMADIFHTLFGLAGLSLLGQAELEPIDPVFCLPRRLL